MLELINDEQLKMRLQRVENVFYISRVTPKVIYTLIEEFENEIVLENQIQKSCEYQDFVDSFEFVSSYLFSKFGIYQLKTRRPCFAGELFINDGYDLIDDYIIKKGRVKERG